MELTTLILLCCASTLAGGMDSIVGGGGLILLPALLLGLPHKQLASVLGTNKLSAVFGTGAAAFTYSRHHPARPVHAVPMVVAGFAGAFCGAIVATQLSTDVLKPLVLFVLVAVWVFTWLRKDFGAQEGQPVSHRRSMVIAICGGLGIGFYDGMIGPGTGSFLLMLLILGEGASFVRASTTAKLTNTATNLGALALFVSGGHVMVMLGLLLGACNVAGSFIGSRIAIRKGSRFVRRVFLVTVAALIVRLAFSVF